ncbi:MAG: SLATT domain-containing protein [Candidatus Thiodiazotropha sp. (ex Semelilucina semeliformis)]|nr:SLATT domain-containing protein [Candidatus Thiodiazotropha sp. (ex Semelilucina semeliformis)]
MENTENLRVEALRIEEDSTYSSKAHYEAARRWGKIYLWLGIPTAIIAGVSGVSAFEEQTLLAGVAAIIAAALASISTFLNPSEKAQAHYTAGFKFTALKNNARIFREIELNDSNSKNPKSDLLKLSSERHSINEVSPQIPRWAFEKARKGIEEGESTYAVDSAE